MSNGPVYRRGSLLWPLLLIAIGGLFLYGKHHPEFSAWALLAKYWPVLIIFWGLSKLVDYLMLRDTPEAAAASRFTAGDIIGLFFLLLIGGALSQLAEQPWWKGGPIRIGGKELACLMGREFEFSETLQESVSLPASIALTNSHGELKVTGTEGKEIRVVANKKACAASDAEAYRYSEAYKPVLEHSGESYSFHWRTQAGESGTVRADLDVQVPKGMTVRLKNDHGDVRVTGLDAAVELDLDHGDVEVDGINGNVRLEMDHGDVHIREVSGSASVSGRGGQVEIRDTGRGASLEGEFYGPIRFYSIGGPTTFNSRRTNFSAARVEGEMTIDSGEMTLRGVRGDITLLTKDKEIELDGVDGALRLENRNGRVLIRALEPPTQPIQIENRAGDVEIILPEASGFDITARTRNGEIESEFEAPTLALKEEGRGDWSLTGSYGRRRAAIQISNTHGGISLRRTGSAQATPPSPPSPPSPRTPPSKSSF